VLRGPHQYLLALPPGARAAGYSRSTGASLSDIAQRTGFAESRRISRDSSSAPSVRLPGAIPRPSSLSVNVPEGAHRVEFGLFKYLGIACIHARPRSARKSPARHKTLAQLERRVPDGAAVSAVPRGVEDTGTIRAAGRRSGGVPHLPQPDRAMERVLSAQGAGHVLAAVRPRAARASARKQRRLVTLFARWRRDALRF